ncbi:MAG: acetyl-CoA C-acyltransferase [Chloroflexi bacterium]|nr:acetyl-CoA C-acyltransferase [Chloroflexota bacterium]
MSSLREVVIVGAVRTPVGRFGGTLRDIPPEDLAALVMKEAVGRTGIDPAIVDGIIMGHCLVNGETPNIARMASLKAGLPIEVPAYSLDRQCGSGLQAIVNAMMEIQSENADVMLAGGVETMSQGEYYVMGARWGIRLGNQTFYDRWERAVSRVSTDLFGVIPNMIYTAENIAEQYGITREEQDSFALGSHQKACAAIAAGKFRDEIISVPVPGPKGQVVLFEQDEHPRPGTTMESLARLKPVIGKTVTAGNSSGMNDAAAVCVLMSAEKAAKHGLEPLGYLRKVAVAGVDPRVMGLGPVPAVKAVLRKANLRLEDVDLIELNEAFAAQALGVLKGLGITDYSNVNVNGSGIALGHPIACTGARIMTTLLSEMRRRRARWGLETMCIGGGMGLAALVERP